MPLTSLSSFDGQTWLLLLNPISGGGIGLRDRTRIESALAAHGMSHVAALSEYPGHILALVSEAIVRGCRRILVAGGDGSLSEAVNGIFTQQAVAPDQVTLALLPIGTGNDWARGRGIPHDYASALRLIAAGNALHHDVGIIDFAADGVSGTRRYFVNVAGTGFDAGVIERMPSRKLGRIAYLVGLLRELASYRPLSLRLKIGTQPVDAEAFVFFACIGRYCGGGMQVAPPARCDDGLFELTLVRYLGRIELLLNLRRLFDGSLAEHPKVSTWQSATVEIDAPHGAAIEADGELVGHAPARLKILPKALRIIAHPDHL
ncbi:MAG: diacylglycerol kinase family protein [Sterolibacterium sp.]|jgi:YegS/Rv2252/BmrU family lipid kinase